MLRRWMLLLVVLVACAACQGPGKIRYADGRCMVDGSPATLAQVEARQAAVTERVQSRQPLLVLVTVLVVVLGGMSHVEKLVLLFSTRGAHTRGLGERIRAMLDRYRAHPVRYFSLVTATLGLLVMSGVAYIYLDADKRASERALAMLQFCHLALRTADEQRVLGEERKNLESIQTTASDIRTLVDKLPPAEQRKAREIIDQMTVALSQQGKLVGEYVQRSDESTRFVKEHAVSVEKGLSELEAGVVSLKDLPTGVHALTESVGQLGGGIASLDSKLSQLEAKLGEQQAVLTAIRDRPAPACSCGPALAATTRVSTAAEARR
jgi:hypothetical protein